MRSSLTWRGLQSWHMLDLCCTPELTRWMTESRDRRAFLRRGFEELRLSIASERQSGVYDRTIQNRIAHFETHGQFFALWDSQRLQKIQDQCQSHGPKPVKLPPNSSAAPSFGQKGTLLFFKAIDDRYLWSNAEISQAVMQLPHDGKDLGIVRVLKLWQLWIWTAPAPNHSLLAREFYGYSVDMGRNLVANCSESWSRDASNLLWKESCFECLADFSDWGSTILGLPAFPSSGGLPGFANTATFEISPTNHP